MNKMIISVLGKDQPGILAAVSRVLLDQECNIENVSQTILQNTFGAILVVSAPDNADEKSLRDKLLSGVTHLNLDIFVKQVDNQNTNFEEPVSHPFVITTVGPDKYGLVAAITSILAKYSVNVTNLQAVFKGGSDPQSNIMIFETSVPAEIDLPSLVKELEQCAQELELEINIQHRKIFETMNRI